MKKVLLGTSAIALAGAFTSPAMAAEWDVVVGGYYEAHTGYADSNNKNISGEFDGVDVKTDAEIHFKPSITLDNGIKIGARVELEGATNSDQIDENYVFIEGSFGQLLLGENDAVSYDFSYTAPDVTFVGVNSGDDTLYLPFAAAFGTTSTFVEVEADSAGLRYTTPRIAGFQLGVSYARDANKATDDAQKDTDASGALHDIWSVAANYVNTFGDFNVAASGGYTRGSRNGFPAVAAAPGEYLLGDGFGFDLDHLDMYDCNGFGYAAPFLSAAHIEANHVVTKKATCASAKTKGGHPTAWNAGLNLGYAGFTIGGSYADYNGAAGDMEVWDAGVSYETGPWGFSFTYVHGDKNDVYDGEIDKFLLGVNYDLAKGVRLNAFGLYDDASSKGKAADYEGDGFVIGTGIRVSF